jgi:hypothetical protein
MMAVKLGGYSKLGCVAVLADKKDMVGRYLWHQARWKQVRRSETDLAGWQHQMRLRFNASGRPISETHKASACLTCPLCGKDMGHPLGWCPFPGPGAVQACFKAEANPHLLALLGLLALVCMCALILVAIRLPRSCISASPTCSPGQPQVPDTYRNSACWHAQIHLWPVKGEPHAFCCKGAP